MLKRKIEGDAVVLYDGAQKVLTLDARETDEGILMELHGELRSETEHEVQDALVALITVDCRVIVDFKQVTYLSQAVVNAMLLAQQKTETMKKGHLLLRNLNDEIYDVLASTGAAEQLWIEE